MSSHTLKSGRIFVSLILTKIPETYIAEGIVFLTKSAVKMKSDSYLSFPTINSKWMNVLSVRSGALKSPGEIQGSASTY